MEERNILRGDGSLSAPEQMRRLVTNYVVSRSVYVAAKLGIADLLVDGPRTVDELAAAVSVQPKLLYRVLRLLEGAGVFAKSGERGFMLNDLADCLRTGAPGSIRSAALLFGEEPFFACGDLLNMVRTGDMAFEHIYKQTHFDYLAAHPQAAETFHDGIRELTGVVLEPLVAAYDYTAVRTLVDVGAGLGLLLAVILRANPAARGVLFELPVALAGAEELMRAEGLLDRCDLVAGDFFDAVPEGGDLYLLKSVVHSWNDEQSIAILRNCRRAMSQDAKLLLIERVVPEGNEPFFPKVNDIIMMVVNGGAERTEAEYRLLYEAAGFRLTEVIPTSSGFSLIEGRPFDAGADLG